MITEKEIIKKEEMLNVKLSNDIMFKTLFTSREKVMLQILKDVFNIKGEVLLSIVGYETVPKRTKGKTFRGDLFIKLSDKTYVSVEMNNTNSKNALDRNMIHLFRIHSDVLGVGELDKELEKYRMYQLNFNNFRNKNYKAIERYGFCDLETHEISSLIYTFCSIDIAKCYKMIYNLGVDKVSKSVRWGAIMLAESIDEISYILGDDMLSMEQKEDFLNVIRELNDDEKVIKPSTWEKMERERYHDDLAYAKEQGIEEVIISMLKENADYNFISKVTGKTLEEIKEIEETI